MMSINNYCTDFMFQEVMMCETCSPLTLSLLLNIYMYRFVISNANFMLAMYVNDGS